MINHLSKGIDRLCYIPSKRLCFVSNPKAGCSSIKGSLWLAEAPETYDGAPHAPNAPFKVTLDDLIADRENLCGSSFFTVVRNPYVRILSAYLEKIQDRNDQNVRLQFLARYGLSNDRDVSFEDFLDIIATDSPDQVDPHFASQHINTLSSVITPAFVGHLERFDRVAEFLSAFGIALRRHAPHATGAHDRVSQFFTRTTLSSVEKLYEQDFELFGYERDINRLAPIADWTRQQDVSKLHSFLVEIELRNENRDLRKSRDELLKEREDLQNERNEYRQLAARLQAQLSATHASTSWRVTAPLRAAAALTKSSRESD